MTLTKPYILALKLQTLALLKLVDSLRGSLGLALSNELFHDLEEVMGLLGVKKSVLRKPGKRLKRRADD